MEKRAAHPLSRIPGLFGAGLRQPSVSAKFDLRCESLKSKFSLILFAYNPMIRYSKKNRELSERVLVIKRKRNPG